MKCLGNNVYGFSLALCRSCIIGTHAQIRVDTISFYSQSEALYAEALMSEEISAFY